MKKTLKIIILNIFLILLVWIFVIFGTKWYLNSYTNHGQQYDVPDFVGNKVNIKDLDLFIENSEINYKIIDSIYYEGLPKGTVIFQSPLPTKETGIQVKKGREIKLRISKDNQLVKMPDLAGKKSKRMAEAILLSQKLVPKITFKQSPEGKNQVMKQMYKGKPIEVGTMIPVNSKIELIVSKGKGLETTLLPSFIDFSVKEVREKTENSSLTLLISCENCLNDLDKDNSIVTKQSPIGGEDVRVSTGSTITIWTQKK